MPLLIHTAKIIFRIVFASILFAACKKHHTPPPATPSADKNITAFSFKQSDNPTYINADVAGTIGGDTITLTVPAETDVTNLRPAITFTGKSISPASGAVQNFSSAVNYIVTASDGSIKKYVVVVYFRSTVFFSSLDGTFYALDALNGQIIWKLYNGQFGSGSPSVYNGVVYCNANDGFYAVDAKTGVQKWKYAIPLSQSGGAIFTPSSVVANNVAYVSAFDGYVYALNTTDGTLKWKTRSTAGNPFTSSVTLLNNLLFAGCGDSYLYALNITTGAVAWKFNAQAAVLANPLVVGNNICIQTKNWYMLNAATGSVVWSSLSIDIPSSPTYDNGRIYLGGGTRAVAVDANTGMQVWFLLSSSQGVIQNERPGPVISNGKMYATSNDGNCYAYDIATKSRLWLFNTTVGALSPNIFASPVLSEGLLYFGNSNGSMYAISAATGTQIWRSPTNNGIYGSACVVDKFGVKHYPAVSGEQQ